MGLTDSDDIAAEQHEGAPIVALPMDAETLLIPNTVAVIRQAPHPEAAQRLFEYLQKPEVVQILISAKALEGESIKNASTKTLQPDWDKLLNDLGPATEFLRKTFLR